MLEGMSAEAKSVARRSGLAESAYAYLSSRGMPVEMESLTRHALALSGEVPDSLKNEVANLLRVDPRFAIDDRGRCSLSSWERDGLPLDDVEFVVFDVESNGGRSGRHRVIEVAGVKTRAGKTIAEYSSLVKLERRLPRFVSDLTGIEPELLEDAPPIESVLGEFAEFANGSILVAHNLPADLSFLNHEAIWAGLARFPGSGLDTMELLASLVPELQQASLVAGLTHFDRAPRAAHRALPDARNTTDLFWCLIELAKGRGASTVGELRDLSMGPNGGALPHRRKELIRWASLNLPALPGVYIFRGVESQALYVGKARSLQRRVRSHFTGERAMRLKWQGLLDATASIDHEVTGSEFSAMLREYELIRDLSPIYNVQLRRRRNTRYVRLGGEADPVAGCVSEVGDDGASYIGPFRTASAATSTARTVRTVFGMPSRRNRFEIESRLNYEAARLFLTRGAGAALELLDGETGNETELARRISRGLRGIRRVSRPIAGGLAGARAIVYGHGPRPDEVEFFLIEQGSVLAREVLLRPPRAAVKEFLREFVSYAGPVIRNDSGSVNLVLGWLHQHFGADEVAVVRGPEDIGRLSSSIWRRVREITRL